MPAVERPLDPRAIARASLQASRNASLWWTCGGVVVACVIGARRRDGSGRVDAVRAAGGRCRGARGAPGPGAGGPLVRSRAIDVTILAFLAIAIAVLAALLPTPVV